MIYKIFFTKPAREMVFNIEPIIRVTVRNKIENLSTDPEKQGYPLLGELKGYRSIHAAGRYRVIYQVQRKKIIVHVIAVGIRKEGDKADIYRLAKRLIKLGLVE